MGILKEKKSRDCNSDISLFGSLQKAKTMRVIVFSILIAATTAADISNIQQLDAARKAKDKNIVLKDINVPAGQTLILENFEPGTKFTFTGRITFGYKEWKGPLIIIKGQKLIVEGKPGHLIDGEGHRWWDVLGGNGGKVKPYFLYVQLTDSKVTGLSIKNTPKHVFAINDCLRTDFVGINIDNADGHKKGGHNTDGFDIAKSHFIRILDSKVNNQDDCLAINSGTNIEFRNNICEGGHGIAVAVGGYAVNEAKNILIKDCQVIKNNIGIRVKTTLNGKGIVDGVTFDNVILKDISEIGIVIIGNYLNSGPRGDPTGDLPIHNLVINNVRGNVLKNGTNHQIWVKNAKNWKWNSNVVGGTKKMPCTGVPNGLKVDC
ncbi:hypothetical protein GE061_012007 [Apolygus lucorum]|uniref:endo-polygalacturonase n=1 Tax=Apolygus lucorum TaxID=248454 RepID=A0A8S9XV69_APOLU|nr:hypothetical protein GE061_012007 [Apolygus lucorum]